MTANLTINLINGQKENQCEFYLELIQLHNLSFKFHFGLQRDLNISKTLLQLKVKGHSIRPNQSRINWGTMPIRDTKREMNLEEIMNF
ncbi:hypothetical protein BpHYR1_003858 [Brachionus plicatilis]|uniref:Uncharacterized protein n=1 Tax=Brachionus plicatilis TaxID=10195 RepID=A0A3M7PAW1_BRAPC|nr:hypothetical protein BpHYR1_003858 [Brachionus plicatilis]